MICLWYLTSVRALYLVKFLVVTFLFLRERSRLRGFCYLVDFLQLAPLQEISSVTYFRLGGILLLGNFLVFVTCTLLGILLSSVTYIRQGGILLLSLFFFAFVTCSLLGILSSSITYIRQGEILLLSLFFFFFLCGF